MYTQRRPLDSDGRGVRRHTAILAGIDHKLGWAFLFSAWAVPYLLNSIPGDIVRHMGCRAFRHRTPSARAYKGGAAADHFSPRLLFADPADQTALLRSRQPRARDFVGGCPVDQLASDVFQLIVTIFILAR